MKGCVVNMEQTERVFNRIDDILIQNGYVRVNIKEQIENYIRVMQDEEIFEYSLYQSTGEFVQYILVLDVGKTEIGKMDLQVRQRFIYEELQETGGQLEPEFDKNVSLLLCVKGDITEERLENAILKIEEDPYCFKKFVLTYTEHELASLNREIAQENVWNYMCRSIIDLQEDKVNIEDEGAKFVLKLFIKMPFLPVEISKKGEKEDLLKEIEENLEPKYQSIWKDIKEMDLDEIGKIKEYSEDQINEILLKWYWKEEKK